MNTKQYIINQLLNKNLDVSIKLDDCSAPTDNFYWIMEVNDTYVCWSDKTAKSYKTNEPLLMFWKFQGTDPKSIQLRDKQVQLFASDDPEHFIEFVLNDLKKSKKN